MKFRKKPLVIEAYQITRELLESVLFDGQKYPEGLTMTSGTYNPQHRTINFWYGSVTTIHNQKTQVVEGDWIITEPDGIHYYPCKPDIFEATYDRVVDEDGYGYENLLSISSKNYGEDGIGLSSEEISKLIQLGAREMGGLANICKMYGSVSVTDENGKTVIWLYDYANDKPRLKSEMTKEEIAASEKAKWLGIKETIEKHKEIEK